MRNLKRYAALPVLLSLILVLNTYLFAQNKTLDRKYDPVIISGDALSNFAGAPIGELFLYSFNNQSKTFTQIPFQFDERGISGTDTSFFVEEDDVLDANDELVFMAADVGDSAVGWVNNADSEQYQRFAIKITDPLSPDKKGWVYLYRSSTLSPQFDPYVQYIPAPNTDSPADTVTGVTYKVGAESAGGFFGFLAFPEVSNLDILDRQKIRVGITLGGFPLTLTEEGFEFVKIDRVQGPVRIIKQLQLFIFEDILTIPFQFFAYSADVGGNFNIPAELSIPGLAITQISQTFDLSEMALGMNFFSNKNPTAISIDGLPDPDTTLINTELDTLPGINWLQVTGDQGTLLNLVEISAIGEERTLSYIDDNANDSSDTGDQMHYGDAGIQVTGDDIEGDFPLGLKSFFLEPNQPSSVGAQLAEFEKNPLTVQSSIEDFNTVSVEQDEDAEIPQSFVLAQNFPNPFNPATVIQYQLPGSGLKTARAILKVYDLLGKEVQTLVDKDHLPGFYEIRWDGTVKGGAKVSSGIYIYQLKFGSFVSSKKMILLR